MLTTLRSQGNALADDGEDVAARKDAVAIGVVVGSGHDEGVRDD